MAGYRALVQRTVRLSSLGALCPAQRDEMTKQQDIVERAVVALERIATAQEKKQAIDMVGMEIAENFTGMIGDIIKATQPPCPHCGSTDLREVDEETEHLANIFIDADEKQMSHYRCPICAGNVRWVPDIDRFRCDPCNSDFVESEVE